MQNVRWWIALSVVGLSPSACGDSFSTAVTQYPSLSEVPYYYATYMCKALATCTPQLIDLVFGPNDCATLLANRLEQALLPNLEAAVDAKTMNFDPSKLDACLHKIKSLGCRALDNIYLPECEAALGGTVPEKGACAFDGECTRDNYCKYIGTCPGVCTTREFAGAPCRDDNECQPGDKCHDGICTMKLAAGEQCTASSVECATGLLCGPDTGSGRTCVAIEAVFSQAYGETCNIVQSQLCAPGSYCAVTEVGFDGATQLCVNQVESGEACKFSFADMCPKDEFCSGTDITATPTPIIEGTCRLLPTHGESCTNMAELGKACAADHVCVSTAEAGAVCHKLQSNGDDCEVAADCYSEYCVGGKCAPKADCEVGS